MNWLAGLRAACGVTRVGDDRALIERGPAGCSGATGWSAEIVEVSTGRAVRQLGADESVWGNALDDRGYVIVATSGAVIDPASGGAGPTVPFASGSPIDLDLTHGIAVVPLTNGGAAVFRRRIGSSSAVAIPFTAVASGGCADVDFPRLVVGPADIECKGMSVRLAPRQLFIASGRNLRDPTDLDIVGIERDDAAHEVRIRYRAEAVATKPLERSPVRVVELKDAPPTGDWLVRLVPASMSASPIRPPVFVVRFSP
jgi:hypothetical protein